MGFCFRNGALYICDRAGMADEVLSLYRQMRGSPATADPDAASFGYVISSMAKK
jgi:hypothetical protein